MRYALLLCLLLTLFPAAQADTKKKITTTDELIQAMQKKYGKSWYKTATFVQKTTNYDKDGKAKVETWYEALAIPGRLRIDVLPVKEGNGILFANGTVYSFKGGKVEDSRPFIHPLTVLGFDIYTMPPQEVTETLKKLKFDLSILREDTWQGRKAYVVGAKEGDLHSPQFWIDAERLYFVRMIRPVGKDGALTSETQFNKYEKLGGGWMAPEVIFIVNGKTVTTEEYSDMRANPKLDPKLFDPQYWTTVHWRE